MKKPALFIIVFLVILGISVLLYFVPLDTILTNSPLIKNVYVNTQLIVNVKKGKAEIKIDGKSFGESPQTIQGLKPGQHDVEIIRVSETEGFYEPYKTVINLENQTEAVIDIEITPAGITNGYILSYSKAPESIDDMGYLSFAVTPEDVSLELDGEFLSYQNNSLQELKTGDYELAITSPNYEDMKFPIIIREGYNLNITAFLYPKPILLESDTL